MDAVLGWLGDVFRALLSFFPHLFVIPVTHGGVKYVWGKEVKPVHHDNGIFKTGVHFYWPAVTKVEIVPIKRQTNNLPPQYLLTKDGKSVGLSGIVIYEVFDVVSLLSKTWDHDQTINDYALAAFRDVISKSLIEDISNGAPELDRKFTRLLRGRLKDFGVKVIRVAISDFAPVRLIGLMSHSNPKPQGFET